MRIRIAEGGVFSTLQGEGIASGTAATFVRLQGCHRRCSFCDEPSALEHTGGEEVEVTDLAERINALGNHHVVITGGEPLMQPAALDGLLAILAHCGYVLHVETAGDFYKSVLQAFDYVTISPKLSSSGTPLLDRQVASVNEILKNTCGISKTQLKFVVTGEQDLDEVHTFVTQLLMVPHHVVLQAEESSRETVEPVIVKALLEDPRFRTGITPWRYMRRLHRDLGVR